MIILKLKTQQSIRQFLKLKRQIDVGLKVEGTNS